MQRPLTNDERNLVTWLLDHDTDGTASYGSQIDRVSVDSVCPCGCPAINFAIDGVPPDTKVRMKRLSDYKFDDDDGRLFGVFLFARGDLLAGLEFWSIDGFAMPHSLPDVDQLRPLKPNVVG